MSAHAEPSPAPLSIDDPIETLEGIGPKRAAQLSEAGVRTIRDLLFYFPRDYADRTQSTPIAEVSEGDRVTIEGEITASRFIRLRGRLNMAEVTLEDATASIKATWFGQGYLARTLAKRKRVVLTGDAGQYKGLALKNPDYEVLSGDAEDRVHTGRIVPIYRLSGKVGQRQLRTWIHSALGQCAESIPETLPEQLRETRNYGPIGEDLWRAHFPETPEQADAARARFAYEELFGLQLGILRSRKRRKDEELGVQHVTGGPLSVEFQSRLPFALTSAQEKAVGTILDDLASARPMARLLQGDVGSGKTLVGLHAAIAAVDGGYQTALMAPTELLAEQHAQTAATLMEPLGVSVALLTGGAAPGKAATIKAIARGDAQIVVGTHTLFQEKTAFKNLGLVVVDEQHRFGVLQRDRLTKKGRYPDILHMTATPIPRTLALTVYGAMDVSIIDELPPGRSPVETSRVPEAGLDDLYASIREEATAGCQTFFICPLVEESEKRALRAVTTHYEALSAGPLHGLRTALVHGRLDAAEKESAMRAFSQGDVDVLFATSVVEVGIDVPNASIMVVEDAGSFGLTQLHQLRGRVGRGERRSRCFLLGEPKTEDGLRRLEALCETNDGFAIAEADLALRGPGQLRGLRQHGESDLRIADLVRDAKLIEQAREDAARFLDN